MLNVYILVPFSQGQASSDKHVQRLVLLWAGFSNESCSYLVWAQSPQNSFTLTNHWHCKWKSWMEAWLGKRHFCNLLSLNRSKVAEPSTHTLLLLQLTCRIEVAGLLRRFTTDRKITIASYVYTERIHLWWRKRESVGSLLRPSHKCSLCAAPLYRGASGVAVRETD